MIASFFKTSSLTLTGTIKALFIAFFCIVFVVVSTIVLLDRQNLLNTISHSLFVSRSSMLKNAVEEYINIPRQADAVLGNALQHYRSDNVPVSEIYADLMNVVNRVYLGNDDLNLIQFGSKNGDYIGISRKASNRQEEYLTLKNAATGDVLTSYSGLSDRSTVAMKNPDYAIEQRPWFQAVFESQKPHWTHVYRDLNAAREFGIAYSIPAFNQQGDFIGVIASELHLQALSKKLQNLIPYENSTLLVLDEQNNIIASSAPGLMAKEKSAAALPSLLNNASPEIEAIGNEVLKAKPSELATISYNHHNYYASRFPVTDFSGKLNWQAVVIVPASAIIESTNMHDYMMIAALVLTFLLMAVLMHFVLSRITLPLRQIAYKTKELENGQWPESQQQYQFREIAELESGFSHLSHRLSDSFDQLRKKIEYDVASGMYTRSGLLNDPRIYVRHNLVALVHVTNMKSIINTLGHKYADAFINEFLLQAEKILPTNIIVARDNIDKFIIVFPGINQESDYLKYQELMNSLFYSVTTEQTPGKCNFLFTGNTGMVLQDIKPETVTDILMHAWIALRHAEKAGNATTRLYSDDMLEKELANIHMHESLSGAIASNELYLVLQPIVGKNERQSCMAGECLVRWHSAHLGEISPESFIPVAEESGLIIPLGRWIIEEACRELAAMIERGAPADFRLHINISSIQLLHQGFAWHLMDTIKLNGLKNENICVEITESVLLRDMQQACQVLDYLRRHGISISLDDFGAGFSSLSYLHALPFDSIKIDRQFVSSQLNNEKSFSVINSVLVLAKGFNVPLIAEGVEEADIEDRLIALGCDQVQGYHLARPALFADWRCENDRFYYKGTTGTTKDEDATGLPEVP